jgi:hypothetical protein
MMVRYQPPVEILKVVDFAVEANPDGFVFVGKRLLPGAEVDDA